MTYVDVLVRLLNELLEDAKPSTRILIAELLTAPESQLTSAVALPEDLIVSVQEKTLVRISMLGILNTALERAGDDRKIIAVVSDDGRLLERVELGPYPKAKPRDR